MTDQDTARRAAAAMLSEARDADARPFMWRFDPFTWQTLGEGRPSAGATFFGLPVVVRADATGMELLDRDAARQDGHLR